MFFAMMTTPYLLTNLLLSGTWCSNDNLTFPYGQLKSLDGVQSLPQLTELYAQKNIIVSIFGRLSAKDIVQWRKTLNYFRIKSTNQGLLKVC